MNTLKDVIMPDGESFDETDWNTYSEKFSVTVKALVLQCPVKLNERKGNIGDYLVKMPSGDFGIASAKDFLEFFVKDK